MTKKKKTYKDVAKTFEGKSRRDLILYIDYLYTLNKKAKNFSIFAGIMTAMSIILLVYK